jgi:hypothetical protein
MNAERQLEEDTLRLQAKIVRLKRAILITYGYLEMDLVVSAMDQLKTTIISEELDK